MSEEGFVGLEVNNTFLCPLDYAYFIGLLKKN